MEVHEIPIITNAKTLGKDDIPEPKQPNEPQTSDAGGEGKDPVETPPEPKEISDEEILAAYEKRFGVKLASVDDLKPKGAEPTAEDIKKAELEQEKQLLEIHLKRGQTAESFVDLKKLANIDPAELTLMELKAEYKAAGFTDEEADERIKNDYYNFTDEEIDEFEEEERDKLRARREFFKPKLTHGSENKKQAAANYFDSLRQEIKNAENEKKEQQERASKVEAFAKTFDRKLKVTLGKHNDMQLDPVEFEFSDEAIKIATNTLKDEAALEQFIYKTDGSLNLERLMPLLALEHDRDSFAKKHHIVGADVEVRKLQKIFPADGHSVAIPSSGIPIGVKGRVQSAKTTSKYD